jgi:hypothetical protein
MTGSAAVMQPSAEHPRTGISGDREQLTHLLRSLAARLDHLDRRITDLTWSQRRTLTSPAPGESACERTTLETERARLSERLGVLATQLRTLDTRVCETAATSMHGRVGTCPYCGYPSLGSGQCAFCRPHLAR